MAGISPQTVPQIWKHLFQKGLREIPWKKRMGSCHRPKNRRPCIHRLPCLPALTKGEGRTKRVSCRKSSTTSNPPLKVSICQWILPDPKERWKVLTHTGLPKLKQVDHTKPISLPTDQRPHLRSCRLSPLLQV